MALTLSVARRCTVEGSGPDGARPIARMCSEAKASVPGWVAAAGGLFHAMLTNQSVFDWIDLRSYDIRERQEQMDHLRSGAMTIVHRSDHSRLVRDLGMGARAIPLDCVRKRSAGRRESGLLPISAVSLLSRAFSESRKVFERHGSRRADQEKCCVTHIRHACTAGNRQLLFLATGSLTRRYPWPRMMGQLVPPPPAVVATVPGWERTP